MNGFIQQVQANCRIAAAGQVGYYSLCGMLLRLRQLYKWEQGLAPWQEGDPKDVLDWIESQEEVWIDLEEAGLTELSWQGRQVDPYAVAELNTLLEPEGTGLWRRFYPWAGAYVLFGGVVGDPKTPGVDGPDIRPGISTRLGCGPGFASRLEHLPAD